jgi:hypothetical protein
VWPGIQGNGELIQDGIYFRRVSQVGTFTTWWEFFPNAVVFSSLTISPGDSVVFAAWEGDSACNFGLRFGTGCFYFQNVTKGTVSGIQIVPDPFPGTFTADSCEGIVERHPPLNLAQWVFAPLQMETDCYDTFGNYENFSLMPYTNITMVNGSNAIMATTTSVSSSLMSFNWVRGN